MLMIAVIPVMVLGGFYYQYFSGVFLSNVQPVSYTHLTLPTIA